MVSSFTDIILFVRTIRTIHTTGLKAENGPMAVRSRFFIFQVFSISIDLVPIGQWDCS
jgi:hypothetical protein